MKKTYGVEFYFCAKYYKFYEYMSSPHFRPTAREINENYPPAVKSTPSSFPGKMSMLSGRGVLPENPE
ncbi:hypothetical protein NKR23_g11760 [Pleurostoma richardsiae]|uniref:Uncharacterized protein n=1 Tax=Pleurostoma richardsiae TaxID=41990 RepID=A0AA38R384_9PEZI|nr:hypothetical protein NKR23_g11760 [Pleurostoma richardsiae]